MREVAGSALVFIATVKCKGHVKMHAHGLKSRQRFHRVTHPQQSEARAVVWGPGYVLLSGLILGDPPSLVFL